MVGGGHFDVPVISGIWPLVYAVFAFEFRSILGHLRARSGFWGATCGIHSGDVRAFCMFLCVLHVDVTCLSYLHVAGILNSAYSSSPMEAGRMRIQRPSESNDQAMM